MKIEYNESDYSNGFSYQDEEKIPSGSVNYDGVKYSIRIARENPTVIDTIELFDNEQTDSDLEFMIDMLTHFRENKDRIKKPDQGSNSRPITVDVQ